MTKGIIVDLETTGLNPNRHEIIEIGIVEFVLSETMKPQVTRVYGSLQQPTQPISAEITRITGLDDAAVAGQKIDWQYVQGFFEAADVVIAHNAAFDRSFLDGVASLEIEGKLWACSQRHINWRKRHFRSASLTYLAADHGFLNPFPHRAVFDCATTLKVVTPYFSELLTRCRLSQVLVRALGAKFEVKDILRQHGYRWDANQRCWYKVLLEDELADERVFLNEEIYGGTPKHHEAVLPNLMRQEEIETWVTASERDQNGPLNL